MTDDEFRAKVDEATRDAIADCPLDAEYSTAREEDGAVAVAEFAIYLRDALDLPVVERPATSAEDPA